MMLDDTIFQSGYRPPVVLTDAIKGEGIDELLQCIWDHKEHVELSGIITEKKKSRFSYKIKELIFTKVEKLIMENFVDENEVNNIVKSALEDGKFNIYSSIHKIFDKITLEIKKNERK
ncbi:MAG: hypothetical protein ACTSQL_10550 [Promethearchaeota archaeon]